MPGCGEKAARLVIEEGARRLLDMQVSDVKALLMSVARPFDARHVATVRPDGGTSAYVGTYEETRLHRLDNMYRFRVGMRAEDSAFTRQGR